MNYFLTHQSTFSSGLVPEQLPTMSCRDIHATNMFAFIIALLSVGALAVATVIPQWRTTRLLTFNRNAKNVTVYDGLWTKCVRREGFTGCYYFDAEWYTKVDQLDFRLLQFCLPAGWLLLRTVTALLSFCVVRQHVLSRLECKMLKLCSGSTYIILT